MSKKKARKRRLVRVGRRGLVLRKGKCRHVGKGVRVCVSPRGAVTFSNLGYRSSRTSKASKASGSKASGSEKRMGKVRKTPRRAGLIKCETEVFKMRVGRNVRCACGVRRGGSLRPRFLPMADPRCAALAGTPVKTWQEVKRSVTTAPIVRVTGLRRRRGRKRGRPLRRIIRRGRRR